MSHEEDNHSVSSDDSYLHYEETDYTKEELGEQSITAGDSEYGVFRIQPWKKDEDGFIVESTYVCVLHSQMFRDYFTKRLGDLIVKRCRNYKGYNNTKKKHYYWKFDIYGSGEEDPDRWRICIPGSIEYKNVWENQRLCANARVELEYDSKYYGRCLVYIYVKTSGTGITYQHYCGEYSYLTEEQMDRLYVNKEMV